MCGPSGKHCVALCEPPGDKSYDYSAGLCPTDYSCIPIQVPIEAAVNTTFELIFGYLTQTPPAGIPQEFLDLDFDLGEVQDFITSINLDEAFLLENIGPGFQLDFEDNNRPELIFV
jgi:hypothetical protein